MAHSQVGEANQQEQETATQDLVTEMDIRDIDIRTATATLLTAVIGMEFRLHRLWKNDDRHGDEGMIVLIRDYRLDLLRLQISLLPMMVADLIALMAIALDQEI